MWNNNDMLSLDRHIGSLKYIIPTIQILSLMKEVEKWLSMNDCGAIIYGRSRVGKTRAITYISEELRNNFGAELPIYVYCATDYPATQKTFYSSLLTVMKHEDAHKGTAVQLRQRLVNRIVDYSLINNFMPVKFFNINYLEDELEKSPDEYYYIYFKEIILRDALDYAIEELSNILEQKLICLDQRLYSPYFPIKFPQYIIKKTGNQWSIVACDPPEGLPDEYSIYEKEFREYHQIMRCATNRCTLKK